MRGEYVRECWRGKSSVEWASHNREGRKEGRVEGMRDAVRQFWEEVGGVGEVVSASASARKECVPLQRRDDCRGTE